MSLFEFLSTYSVNTDAVIKAIVHSQYPDSNIFTIYSDAIEYVKDDIKNAKVIDWIIEDKRTVEIWLEDSTPSG